MTFGADNALFGERMQVAVQIPVGEIARILQLCK
jgi:hypothetical protein